MSDENKDTSFLQEAEGNTRTGESSPAEVLPPSPENGDGAADPAEENAPEDAAGREEGEPGDEPAGDNGGNPVRIPVLPLRGGVVFSSMIVPIFEDRRKVLKAAENALESNRRIFLCAQKDPSAEYPEPGQLYSVGVIAQILRMSKTGEGQVRILAQASSRAEAVEFSAEDGFLMAYVRELEEKASDVSDVEMEALMRLVREQSERILQLRGISAPDVVGLLNSVEDPGRLSDLIAANAHVSIQDAQKMLECLDPVERLRIVGRHLSREVEIASIQAKIQGTAHADMEKGHKEYVLKEQLKAIHKELGDEAGSDEDLAMLRKQLDEAGLSAEARKEADRQLRRLNDMNGDSPEAAISRAYLDLLGELPWKKISRDRIDISRAEAMLDEELKFHEYNQGKRCCI